MLPKRHQQAPSVQWIGIVDRFVVKKTPVIAFTNTICHRRIRLHIEFKLQRNKRSLRHTIITQEYYALQVLLYIVQPICGVCPPLSPVYSSTTFFESMELEPVLWHGWISYISFKCNLRRKGFKRTANILVDTLINLQVQSWHTLQLASFADRAN